MRFLLLLRDTQFGRYDLAGPATGTRPWPAAGAVGMAGPGSAHVIHQLRAAAARIVSHAQAICARIEPVAPVITLQPI